MIEFVTVVVVINLASLDNRDEGEEGRKHFGTPENIVCRTLSTV